ncbi:hypothetical protein GUITHDRAFT_117458 [Guillardia theta CCMP2712]|uniref:Uncharacterized protein n=1 Tax=Guillardia theta (strain CCMP2712) TaxID=905079 RepID=L1IKB5_GUITC|nr:hypothetical protein GUITHDRAFT_117458 [Guillardia theta CCMP2712]EKX36349.1 hypothetical protein GUITHDRAFT_117458 [Guillardia theta CCMP2712]|eukprot:XP_005823329.1 hypothetical protein GUITHDRAFT_117458 [Guillardia theta CCMP2712]
MVRPAGSEENKRLALKFAEAVTVPHGKEVSYEHTRHHFIARTGKLSIFAALQQCCPSAVRNDDPFIGRLGLTEVELNKVLERNNFKKVRDRRSNIITYPKDDQEPAAPAKTNEVRHYFAERRWRNPDDPDDAAQLEASWQAIKSSSIPFAGQCALDKFMTVSKTFHDQWETLVHSCSKKSDAQKRDRLSPSSLSTSSQEQLGEALERAEPPLKMMKVEHGSEIVRGVGLSARADFTAEPAGEEKEAEGTEHSEDNLFSSIWVEICDEPSAIEQEGS